MINKTLLIQKAMLMIGETSDYNNNKSDIYKIAETLLDGIVSDLSSNEAYLFNAVEAELTRTPNKSGSYNVPVGFLTLIASDNELQRVGNEFLGDGGKILYCQETQFNDLPNNISNLLTFRLAVEVAMTNETFSDKVSSLSYLFDKENAKYINSQTFNWERYRG